MKETASMTPRTILIAMLATSLAGCASTGLISARSRLDAHMSAPNYVNVELIDTAGTTEAQRAPEITARKGRAKECHQAFHDSFVELVRAGAPTAKEAADAAGQLDERYDECVRRFGLTGHPEFKVGDAYLRPAQFVWSWYGAQQAMAHAQAASDNDVAAWVGAFGVAGRNAAAQAPRPVNCTSTPIGNSVSTTCR